MSNFRESLKTIEEKWGVRSIERLTSEELDKIVCAVVSEKDHDLYCNFTLKSGEVEDIWMSTMSNVNVGDILDPKWIYKVMLENPGDPNISVRYILMIYYGENPNFMHYLATHWLPSTYPSKSAAIVNALQEIPVTNGKIKHL